MAGFPFMSSLLLLQDSSTSTWVQGSSYVVVYFSLKCHDDLTIALKLDVALSFGRRRDLGGLASVFNCNGKNLIIVGEPSHRPVNVDKFDLEVLAKLHVELNDVISLYVGEYEVCFHCCSVVAITSEQG